MGIINRRKDIPFFDNYSEYKKFLRADFFYMCAYCKIHENYLGGPRLYSVDHFRPKKTFQHLLNAYDNLVYACAICNSFKKEDWPSDDPISDGKGYIDPCVYDYDEHFIIRYDNYQVDGRSNAALYMIERLHLNRKQLKIIRKRERDEIIDHEQFLELANQLMSYLRNEIEDSKNDDGIGILRDRISILEKQISDHILRVQERFNPIINMEDYR